MENLFYLAQIFGALGTISRIVLAISGMALFVSGIIYLVADEENDYSPEDRPNAKKVFKRTLPIAIVSLLFVVFVPTKKTFLFMVGGHAVDKAIERNPEVKDIPGNTLELLNEYIKSETKELREKKK